MKILSIDIGIKNLAYIILDINDSSYTIIDWNIINLSNYNNCTNCTNQATFVKDNIYYCKKHAKLCNFIEPGIHNTHLKRNNIKDLFVIANNYNIEYNNKIKKNDLINLITNYQLINYLNIVQNINSNTINLIDIGINIKQKFNNVFNSNSLINIDYILLENQIGPIANRMKTIQGMLAQYFISNDNYNIKFVSSINKLSPFIKEKLDYKQRKCKSVEITNKLIYNQNIKIQNEFNNSKKKDDLSDCFLQAIAYIIQNKLSKYEFNLN